MSFISGYHGEIAAIMTTLSWSIGVFPITEAARRLGPNTVNHYRLLLAALLLTIILITFSSISLIELFTLPDSDNWLWLGMSGIIGLTLGDYFGFTMFAIIGTRIGSLFSTLAPGAALLFGYFLINESISVTGIIGILITIAGVAWLSISKKEKAKMQDLGHGNINKGIFFGILSAICQGIGLVMAKKGFYNETMAGDLNAIHATWIRMTIATLTLFLFTLTSGKIKAVSGAFIQNKDKGIIYMLAGTVFGPVIGVSMSLYTISFLKVSVAQTIFSLVPVFVLLLAFLFYKEKITLKSLTGALIAITGVIVLIWRDEIREWLF